MHNTHVLNLFELTNTRELNTSYRLIDIDGPFGTEDRGEANLSLLAKRVAIQERAPVAIVRRDGGSCLAIPSSLKLTQLEYALTPDVVSLRPKDAEFELRMDNPNPGQESIAKSFLSFALRSPLRNHADLWSTSPSSYFLKHAENFKDSSRDVDLFPGFGFRVIRHDQRWFISLWLTSKYVETRWALDCYSFDRLRNFKMRHFLYHYGNRWFPIQILDVLRKNIREQRFHHEEENEFFTVLDYTLQECSHRAPSWIKSLDPASPAISYQYPGNEKKRYGAAALCKLLLSTDDERVAKLHRRSIRPPGERFGISSDLIREFFSSACLNGKAIQISPKPLERRSRLFRIPALEFGQEAVLRVGSGEGCVALRDMPKERLAMVLDPSCGMAVPAPLDTQYLLIPETLPRGVGEAFYDRIQKAAQQLRHAPYSMRLLRYRNEQARTIKAQVNAITKCLDDASVQAGHGLLVLPSNAQPYLHNCIKRRLRNRLLLQCASASRLERFYELRPRNGKAEYVVSREGERRYPSYLRNLAMGLMLVNGQIPWVLRDEKHYDAYIGLDVLHNTAAGCFLYERGTKCVVRTWESQQSEKLTRKQIRTALYEALKLDIPTLGKLPRSLVLRRDGRSFHCEWLGFQDAIRQLIAGGLLPQDLVYGIVEVHKHFGTALRIATRSPEGELRNPRIGSYYELDEVEGILCNTGYPFSFDGTVKPLLMRIAFGNLVLSHVLEDAFADSLLSWPVPDRCIRLPVDLARCDDVLRSIAAETDEDEALYGDDAREYSEESSEMVAHQ